MDVLFEDDATRETIIEFEKRLFPTHEWFGVNKVFSRHCCTNSVIPGALWFFSTVKHFSLGKQIFLTDLFDLNLGKRILHWRWRFSFPLSDKTNFCIFKIIFNLRSSWIFRYINEHETSFFIAISRSLLLISRLLFWLNSNLFTFCICNSYWSTTFYISSNITPFINFL